MTFFAPSSEFCRLAPLIWFLECEEFFNWNLKDARNIVEHSCAETIDACFVLLKLLMANPQSVTQLCQCQVPLAAKFPYIFADDFVDVRWRARSIPSTLQPFRRHQKNSPDLHVFASISLELVLVETSNLLFDGAAPGAKGTFEPSVHLANIALVRSQDRAPHNPDLWDIISISIDQQSQL